MDVPAETTGPGDDALTSSQAARRDRIVTAALGLAAAGGFDAVQMREVAARAVLESIGIPVVPAQLVTSSTEAAQAAARCGSAVARPTSRSCSGTSSTTP